MIPVNISNFQKIIKETSRTRAGMLCIKKALIVCQKPNPSLKTSSEKTIKKAINKIPKILGVQYKNLFIIYYYNLFIKKLLNYFFLKPSRAFKTSIGII